jgi:hypothetical protein
MDCADEAPQPRLRLKAQAALVQVATLGMSLIAGTLTTRFVGAPNAEDQDGICLVV